MNNQKLIIESLAMDLKRVALGLHRGSFVMADRFKDEALKRGSELENQELGSYIKKILERTKEALLYQKPDSAEDILMYSTLFQNFALKKM
ncbi:hypothetical protein A3D83_04530 [Candidatus Daviesbacteria bacterium RIFCSPHIGHO2_02_FULL_41_10]|uniref:Uncharacterized protein n=2 Tax=Candidatus Daviesiibacteriota TaxID=1752718 RepID=A0A1F5IRC0_9BACT|nr:MAG: hypothetical protein A2871_02655 [Candidatus Daviesbacteria bacterium RIFCSPHIGHO2_01_FULL_41_23]OGE33810.1 MAG: hypothetical protein A3D83_04530 [Candidatus Daviesbacteria bacterium RIFCSPHIGHO2_02_FULL_41_10]OGE62077.1 MAG: hypothetical protein A2967_00270 [Candidatus Daviesbacteria bacterium RIFCSPLOWO2_01_FULL_41_32]